MRCLYALLLIAVMSTLGCKTERLKTPDSSSSPQKPHSEETRLHGRVGLGVGSQAQVFVHRFQDGRVDWNTPIGYGETDAAGAFLLEVDADHLAQPVVVRAVVLAHQTNLKCTLNAGCGSGVQLGEEFRLNNDLELFLAVPNLQNQSVLNVSVLSHLAFKLLTAQAGDKLEQLQIERANSTVSSRFGAFQELASLSSVNLNYLEDSYRQHVDAIYLESLNLAIIQTAQKYLGATGIPDALSAFVDQYIDFGIPDIRNSDTGVSYADILQEASAILTAIQQQQNRDLRGVVTELESKLALLSIAGSDEYQIGQPSVTAGSADIDKAKGFVYDVRGFAASIDLYKLAGMSNLSQMMEGGISNILNLFGDNADTSEIFQDKNFDTALSALGFAAEAAFSSLVDYYADSVIRTSYEGVTFVHNVGQGGNHLFIFQTVYDSCLVKGSTCPANLNLNFIMRVTRFTGNAGTRTFAPDAFDVRIGGAVSAAAVELSFPQSDFQIRTIMPSISVSDYGEDLWVGDEYVVSIDAMRVRLPFEVKKAGEISESKTFKAFVSVDSGKLRLKYTDRSILSEESGRSPVSSEAVMRINTMENFKIGFSNVVNDASASAFNVAQGVSALPEELTIIRSVIHCSPADSGCKEKADFHIEGESEERFLALNASASFKTKLKSVNDPAFVQLSVERGSPYTNTVKNIRVGYSGHGMLLNGRFNNNGGMSALETTNLDGTRLYFDTINKKRTGAVEISSGEKAADIIDMGQWVKVRYMNGDFESF
ncbi:hypothetical protein [Saccharophagus sp. K07]|uniref:hypothetical protein n=1 Tax=Saccharophagus sp. K07 TaxID=2283636 RepID=UPI001651FDD3|nr:hypothetical protein [Saccharophagus sp. K07]